MESHWHIDSIIESKLIVWVGWLTGWMWETFVSTILFIYLQNYSLPYKIYFMNITFYFYFLIFKLKLKLAFCLLFFPSYHWLLYEYIQQTIITIKHTAQLFIDIICFLLLGEIEDTNGKKKNRKMLYEK